jgi:hypothetical protein
VIQGPDSGFRAQGFRAKVLGFGFRVKGFRVWGLRLGCVLKLVGVVSFRV